METNARDKLVSRIFLRSALPLTKVILQDNPKLAKAFEGLTATVQFVGDSDAGPVGAHLLFQNGVLEVVQGVAEKADLTFAFNSLAQMNALFSGKLVLPRIQGFTNIGLLFRTLRLLLELKLLMPSANPSAPERRRLKVKLLLYMVASALSQLNKGGDAEMTAYTAKMPDRIFQWSIEPEGIACYLRVKAGKSKAGRGLYTRKMPVVHMRFQGIEGAYPVLTSQMDTVEAILKGNVVIDGSPEYGKDIGVFMKRVESLVL